MATQSEVFTWHMWASDKEFVIRYGKEDFKKMMNLEQHYKIKKVENLKVEPTGNKGVGGEEEYEVTTRVIYDDGQQS